MIAGSKGSVRAKGVLIRVFALACFLLSAPAAVLADDGCDAATLVLVEYSETWRDYLIAGHDDLVRAGGPELASAAEAAIASATDWPRAHLQALAEVARLGHGFAQAGARFVDSPAGIPAKQLFDLPRDLAAVTTERCGDAAVPASLRPDGMPCRNVLRTIRTVELELPAIAGERRSTALMMLATDGQVAAQDASGAGWSAGSVAALEQIGADIQPIAFMGDGNPVLAQETAAHAVLVAGEARDRCPGDTIPMATN